VRGLLIASHLALRDFLHERLMSACAVLSLASILVPLLVLAGVRYGVVNALKERLLRDPTILTVLPTGSGSGYSLAWIEKLKERPEVAFVIPRTRDIAATMQFERPGSAGGKRVAADMEPTAAGDPLLEQHHAPIPTGDQVVLSASAARKLDVKAGDPIVGSLGRRLASGKLESVSLPLTVVSVLPLEAEDKDVAFLELSLLEAAECYRDGIAVPSRGFSGDAPGDAPRQYSGFRLYARDMESVAPLRDYLTGKGIEVVTRAREIQAVQGLDHSLTLIFALIAASAGAGFMASTASSVMASVRRKDKYLAMIRLLGFTSAAVRLFPIVQSLLTAVCGSLLAVAAYAAIGLAIDALFSDALYGEVVCRLPLTHLLLTFGLVVLLSLLASVQASVRAARIDPSEVLREL